MLPLNGKSGNEKIIVSALQLRKARLRESLRYSRIYFQGRLEKLGGVCSQ